MGMKGDVGWSFGVMMALLLLLVAGVFLTIYITGGGGFIRGYLDELCEKYPTFFGCPDVPAGDDPNYPIAVNSVKALHCAVNSVALGREWGGCSSDVIASSGLSVSGQVVGAGEEAKLENASVECNCDNTEIEYQDDRAVGECIVTFKYEDEWKWKSKCLNRGTYNPVRDGINSDKLDDVFEEIILNKSDGLVVYYNDFDKGIEIFQNAVKSDVSKGDDEIEVSSATDSITLDKDNIDRLYDSAKPFCVCTVRDFQLPQEVTDNERWIIYFGDPKFLVYWQDFPMEWDTWSYSIDWKTHAAIIAVTALPTLKVAGAGAKLLGASGKIMFKGSTATVRRAALKTAIKSGIREGSKDFLKFTKRFARHPVEAAKSLFPKHLLRKAAIYGGLTTTFIAMELFESISDKYEPHRNSLVLKIPYFDAEKYRLVSEARGKPVLITWEPDRITDRLTHAHLVSPCFLREITVDKKQVVCNYYSLNPNNGVTSCNSGEIEKDSFFKNLWKAITFAEDEPECDITTYLGINDPYVNNMDIIKSAYIEDLVRELKRIQLDDFVLEEAKVIDETDENGDLEIKWIPLRNPPFPKIPNPIDPSKLEPDYPFRIKIKYNGMEEILSNSDDDEYFDSYSLKDCRTESVVMSFNNENKPSSDELEGYNTNYCVDERGNWEKAKEWGGLAIGTACIVACWFIPGPGWVAGVASGTIIIGAASLEISGVYDQYTGAWPGE